MTRNIMIILNAIAFSLNGYSYTGPKKGSRWGKLEIGSDDETQTIMTVFDEDFDWASKLIDVNRSVPYEQFAQFWYDHTIIKPAHSFISKHRVIAAAYLDWIDMVTDLKGPKYKKEGAMGLAAMRIAEIAKASTDPTTGNTTKADWIEQFKDVPEVLPLIKLIRGLDTV